MKHTPEPWEVDRLVIRQTLSGKSIGDCDEGYWVPRTNQANADRIIDCVNALAGIENPEEWAAEAKEIKQKYFAATAELLADGLEALDRNGLLGTFREENKELFDKFTKILRGLEMRPSSGLSTRAKELMGGQDG